MTVFTSLSRTGCNLGRQDGPTFPLGLSEVPSLGPYCTCVQLTWWRKVRTGATTPQSCHPGANARSTQRAPRASEVPGAEAGSRPPSLTPPRLQSQPALCRTSQAKPSRGHSDATVQGTGPAWSGANWETGSEDPVSYAGKTSAPGPPLLRASPTILDVARGLCRGDHSTRSTSLSEGQLC